MSSDSICLRDGARLPPASCFTGDDRPSLPTALVHSQAVPAAHLLSAKAIIWARLSWSITVTFRGCHCHEPSVAYSLFRWLSAVDSWALCLRRPPLFFNPLISAKNQRDFISLSHAVSRQSFLPSSAFLTRCFSAPGVSLCSSSYVFPNTVSRGCCFVFNVILLNCLLAKQSREELLFVFVLFFKWRLRPALAHSVWTLEQLRLFLEYVWYLPTRLCQQGRYDNLS